MYRIVAITILLGIILSGCERQQPEGEVAYTAQQGADLETTGFAESATARISGLDANPVDGLITFEEKDGFLLVRGMVSSLERGKHGFHIHSGLSCENRGGHLNPENVKHGSPDEQIRHLGDLGNLVADSTGTARYERIDRRLSLTGDRSIAGHVLVVHAGEDTYLAQPSGASGTEIGCGIITME